jgi:hypothetical protein
MFHSRQIMEAEEKFLDLRQREVDGIVAAHGDRTPAELPGGDTSAIKQVDPSSDDESFRAIAGETLYKVRETRRLQNPQEPETGRTSSHGPADCSNRRQTDMQPLPALRESDADRDRVIELLHAAVVDGRFDPAEFDDRLGAALSR